MEMTIESALKLAIEHQQARRPAEAEAIYRQVLAVSPRQADALHLYGVLQREAGNLDAALRLIDAAIEARPATGLYFSSRAAVLRAAGRVDEAILSYQQAIALKPDRPDVLHQLGMLLHARGRLGEAIAAFRSAVAIDDRVSDVHHDLAISLHSAGQGNESASLFHRVLQAQPRNVQALNNFANLLKDTGHLAKARQLYELALAIEPSRVEIQNNLADLHRSAGRIGEAIECYQRMLDVQPEAAEVQSNILLSLNYLPSSDSGLLWQHQAWAQKHAARFYPTAEAIARSSGGANRKVRIGYVSGDFRGHCVMSFLKPILAGHDRSRFEIYCYSNVGRPDDVTASLRAMDLTWREIRGLPDDRAAEMVRADQIDILIDLAGHTADHRLLLFARKPAPVQMTYLGYPNTTGLATMDYRITDADADPPGMTESHHTEKLLRLPFGFLCFDPPANAPDLIERPQSDQVVFGSFNNIAKVSDVTFDLWARLLREIPSASLLLKRECLADPSERDATIAKFTSRGVDASRLELIGRSASFREHLGQYSRMDIALDTFPYHGTTTTCEALWMGVPVITLAGNAHVSRVGVSLLRRVGLDELIAESADDYVAIATRLAGDANRRREISGARLRERMNKSKLTHQAEFARQLEASFDDALRDTPYRPSA